MIGEVIAAEPKPKEKKREEKRTYLVEEDLATGEQNVDDEVCVHEQRFLLPGGLRHGGGSGWDQLQPPPAEMGEMWGRGNWSAVVMVLCAGCWGECGVRWMDGERERER
jgi:hypothetical protein